MKSLIALTILAASAHATAFAGNPADAAKQQSAVDCKATEKAAYDHFELGGVWTGASQHSGPKPGVGGDLVRAALGHKEAYENLHMLTMSNLNHCEALQSDGPSPHCGEEHYQQEMKLTEANEAKEAAAYCAGVKDAYARFQELKAISKRVCGIFRPTPMLKRTDGEFKEHKEYCDIINK